MLHFPEPYQFLYISHVNYLMSEEKEVVNETPSCLPSTLLFYH